MVTFRFMMADICIRCEVNYRFSETFCSDYLTDAPEEMAVSVSFDEIKAEAKRYGKLDPEPHAQSYYESLALYRKICTEMAFMDRMLIHGSSLMTDGQAFLFCAPSGTGKSTHTRLWREVYGEKIVMINDDKPLVRLMPDGSARIYGTPWNGKHHLGANISAPLKNICFLARGEKNEISPVDASEGLPRLLKFSFRPDGAAETAAMLGTAHKLAGAVKLWDLRCNMDPEAAVVSCEGMTGKAE